MFICYIYILYIYIYTYIRTIYIVICSDSNKYTKRASVKS